MIARTKPVTAIMIAIPTNNSKNSSFSDSRRREPRPSESVLSGLTSDHCRRYTVVTEERFPANGVPFVRVFGLDTRHAVPQNAIRSVLQTSAFPAFASPRENPSS